MSSVTVNFCIHADPPHKEAILVSTDGHESHASWLPRSMIRAREPLGETKAVSRHGQIGTAPMEAITLPAWKARQEGWV